MMSDNQTSFARAIDSQFERLGQDAIYISAAGQRRPIRVIARLPEQLFELGEQSLHAENIQLSFRAADVATPKINDAIYVDEHKYQIKSEPLIATHRLVCATPLMMRMRQ